MISARSVSLLRISLPHFCSMRVILENINRRNKAQFILQGKVTLRTKSHNEARNKENYRSISHMHIDEIYSVK